MPESLTLETSHQEGEILNYFDYLIVNDWGIFYDIYKVNFGFKFQSKRAGIANLFRTDTFRNQCAKLIVIYIAGNKSSNTEVRGAPDSCRERFITVLKDPDKNFSVSLVGCNSSPIIFSWLNFNNFKALSVISFLKKPFLNSDLPRSKGKLLSTTAYEGFVSVTL